MRRLALLALAAVALAAPVGAQAGVVRPAPEPRFFDPVVEIADAAPDDALWPLQWGAARTDTFRAWTLAATAAPVVVAVLDTGVDAAAPDLQGKLVPGYDVVDGDADPADDHGHGTAVAGVVAATAGNGIGAAGYCRTCLVMPVKVLGSDGSGYSSTVAAGIVWAVDHGARVVNLSLGGPTQSPVLSHAIRYARERGAVVVAAAGNDGSTSPSYPAADPGVVAVAATDEHDSLYPWSNSGPWVRLAAPGQNVTTGLGGTYVGFGGTSSATPVVAALAGMALGLAAATPARVEESLAVSAAPVAGIAAGRVDAFRTLAALGAAAPPSPAPAGSDAPPAAKKTQKKVRAQVSPRKRV